MPVTATTVALYLAAYATAFQEEYHRLTEPSPSGPGYPPFLVSPYLGPGTLDVVVSSNGVVIYSTQPEPPYDWWLAGGPALVVDYPESRTPPWVTRWLETNGLANKPIGMYRVVSQLPLPNDVWSGELGRLVEEVVSQAGTCVFRVKRREIDRDRILHAEHDTDVP